MKTILLTISILFLSATAPAQRAVEPVRVLVNAPQGEANAELADDVRAELRKLRDVVITGRNADYELQLNAHVIAADRCKGVAVAALVVRRADNLHDLTVYVGADSREVAAFIVAALNKEHFAPRREAATNRRK